VPNGWLGRPLDMGGCADSEVERTTSAASLRWTDPTFGGSAGRFPDRTIAGGRRDQGVCGGVSAASFISFCPRRIEHHSLCSAIGIPHSTQIRIRCFGGSTLFPNRRFNNDMSPPVPGPMMVVYVRRHRPVPGWDTSTMAESGTFACTIRHTGRGRRVPIGQLAPVAAAAGSTTRNRVPAGPEDSIVSDP
jgi:hypothetical protein